MEQHYRVNEVALRLGVSRQTVERRFSGRAGVMYDGRPSSTTKKRRYGMLLIPESALEDYLRQIGGEP